MVGLPDTSERGPFNYHNSKVLFNFDQQFQRRIFLNDFLGELGIIYTPITLQSTYTNNLTINIHQ
jgi:hypothetical protein